MLLSIHPEVKDVGTKAGGYTLALRSVAYRLWAQGLDCSKNHALFFHCLPSPEKSWQSLGQILSLMCNCPCDFGGEMISLEFYSETIALKTGTTT